MTPNKDGGGLRFNEGKPPIHLVPPSMTLAVASVLGYGAKKYTKKQELYFDEVVEWIENAFPVNVQVTACTLTDVAGRVTKKNSESLIRSLLSDSEKTGLSGEQETPKELSSTVGIGRQTQSFEQGTPQLSAENILKVWGLQKRVSQSSKNLKEESARFVERLERSFTSTTTTLQVRPEGFFVLDATTALDFLTTLLSLCKELFPTYKNLQPTTISSNNEDGGFFVVTPGDRNWERGMKWSVPYDSMMRHLLAWQKGEDTDPESGLPHLHHVACNIAMLVEFMDTYKEGDDRPGKGNVDDTKTT